MTLAFPSFTIRVAAAVARRIAFLASLAFSMCSTSQAQTVNVYAAGSLKDALTEMAEAFKKEEAGVSVQFTFGASGLLRDRLAGGERADVFASANMAHPQALADAGRAGPVRRFTRNALCALAPKAMALDPENLVRRMLDPGLRLATSTPMNDPAGDYTWQMFERIEQQRPGAFRVLSSKALQLTGGPQAPVVAAGRNVYGELLAQGRADMVITYCTGALVAAREQPQLQVIALPAAIGVSASYGVTQLRGADAAAARFVDFMLGPVGQGILGRLGFAPA